VGLDVVLGHVHEMHSVLGFLASLPPEEIGPLTTGGAAVVAGAIEGCFGPENNKIGPVTINMAAAVVFAAGALFGPTTAWREASAAGARGFGSPLVYQWAHGKGAAWAARRVAAKTAVARASSAQRSQ
jgi:hypothetical protein